MIRVGVLGAAGRMGRTVCATVAAAEDMQLVAAVDPAAAGASVAELIGEEATGDAGGVTVADSADALVEAGVQVGVDFTVLDSARQNLASLAAGGIHAVVGTTGFTPQDLERAAGLFDRSNCIIAPNFALSAVLMMRFAELAAPLFDSAEVIELHHDAKVDAPSGTAMMTAERMAAASEDWNPDPTQHGATPRCPRRTRSRRDQSPLDTPGRPGSTPGGHPRHPGPRPSRSEQTPTTAPHSCQEPCWQSEQSPTAPA